jgi:hypothetical protein
MLAASEFLLMKIISLSLLAAACFLPRALFAGPAEEKAFCDKYKAAYEAGDKATLESFLYTKGADPMALEFYKMMATEGAGGKVSKIELVDLSPEDAKKAGDVMEGPGDQKMKLPLKATKKLKLTVESKDGNGSSSSSSESFIAENDGKFVIPVPVAVK